MRGGRRRGRGRVGRRRRRRNSCSLRHGRGGCSSSPARGLRGDHGGAPAGLGELAGLGGRGGLLGGGGGGGSLFLRRRRLFRRRLFFFFDTSATTAVRGLPPRGQSLQQPRCDLLFGAGDLQLAGGELGDEALLCFLCVREKGGEKKRVVGVGFFCLPILRYLKKTPLSRTHLWEFRQPRFRRWEIRVPWLRRRCCSDEKHRPARLRALERFSE